MEKPLQPETSPNSQPSLIERIEAAKARARSVEESLKSEKTLEPGTQEWDREIRILKSRARTKAIEAGRLEDRAIIDSQIIISDDIIPDAHKNEIGISAFKSRYLGE